MENLDPASLAARLRRAGCVFAEEEARLLAGEAATGAELEAMLDRRAGGEPLEHILGWCAFLGLRPAVAPGVFVPRRRSEFLAEGAVRALAGRTGANFVELCCGTGAVTMAAMAGAAPGCLASVHAVDILPAAVASARRNLPAAVVLPGDLWQALPDGLRGRVDVAVANAPYVPTARLPTLPREARGYEPALTHDGGPDGLAVIRRLVAEGAGWLAPGGQLLLECGGQQASTVRAMLQAAGLNARITRCAAREATVLIGTRRRRAGP